MGPTRRKLVTIITEAAIEKDLLEKLEALQATGYTITDARGKGRNGIRSSAWEFGANIRVEIVCDSGIATAITQRLQQDYYPDYAMIIFTSEVEVLRPEKF